MISFLQCIIFEPISYSEFILGQKSLQKFRWFFGRFERHQKDILKLTDLSPVFPALFNDPLISD